MSRSLHRRSRAWALHFFCCISVLTMNAKAASPRPLESGKIQALDPAFEKLVASDAKLEVIGEGFAWCEGPVWVRDEGFLLFSDIPHNRIMRWDAKSGCTEFLKPAGYTGNDPRGGESGSNGLTVDR